MEATAPSTQSIAIGATTASHSHSVTAKPRMKHLDGALYLVESSTKPGVGHKVDVLNLRCNCTAGQYGKRCHHLVWAIQMDAWRRGIQAQSDQQRTQERAATRPKGMAALQEAYA